MVILLQGTIQRAGDGSRMAGVCEHIIVLEGNCQMSAMESNEATLRDVVNAIEMLGERLDRIVDEMESTKIEVMTVREAIEALAKGNA